MSSSSGDPAEAPQGQPRSADDWLLFSAYRRNMDGVRKALAQGADVNFIHPQTGLSALHIAVGSNNRELTRYLIDVCGARFFPDRFGRWPSLVAIECRVDEELGEYVAREEAAYLSRNPA